MSHLREDTTQMDARRQEMSHLRDGLTQMDARLRQEMGHLRDDMTRLGERVTRRKRMPHDWMIAWRGWSTARLGSKDCWKDRRRAEMASRVGGERHAEPSRVPL